MGCMPLVNDDGYDAVDEMEMVIDDEEHQDRPASSTLERSPMVREEKNSAGCTMVKLPKGPTVAVNRGAGDCSVNTSERMTRSKSGHLPNSISRTTSDGTCGHTSTTDHHTTDHHTTDHESSYCSCQVGSMALIRALLLLCDVRYSSNAHCMQLAVLFPCATGTP